MNWLIVLGLVALVIYLIARYDDKPIEDLDAYLDEFRNDDEEDR